MIQKNINNKIIYNIKPYYKGEFIKKNLNIQKIRYYK